MAFPQRCRAGGNAVVYGLLPGSGDDSPRVVQVVVIAVVQSPYSGFTSQAAGLCQGGNGCSPIAFSGSNGRDPGSFDKIPVSPPSTAEDQPQNRAAISSPLLTEIFAQTTSRSFQVFLDSGGGPCICTHNLVDFITMSAPRSLSRLGVLLDLDGQFSCSVLLVAAQVSTAISPNGAF
jgi:hypothetical protein